MSTGRDLFISNQAEWSKTGMYANLGITVSTIGERDVELVANPDEERHGFGTPRGSIIHGGAVATIADCALACAAMAAAGDGELCTTADLRVDFFRPTRPGSPVIARAEVRHRTRRLAYCAATLMQDGEVVAEARATLVYLKADRATPAARPAPATT
ncbi:MAG TPA: PaaI family thioesterase [Candidatus Dormibacteraeota bacterium]|nr:PaaI family thioesterase [Candidatus Dormibacteraeota bacterium]